MHREILSEKQKVLLPLLGQFARANEIFNQLWSEKLFRTQLSYFDDIDYYESVEFVNTPVPEEEIRSFLAARSIEISL